jgi:hypothetical protein
MGTKGGEQSRELAAFAPIGSVRQADRHDLNAGAVEGRRERMGGGLEIEDRSHADVVVPAGESCCQ